MIFNLKYGVRLGMPELPTGVTGQGLSDRRSSMDTFRRHAPCDVASCALSRL